MIEDKREIRIEGLLDGVKDGNANITIFSKTDDFISEDVYNLNDILKIFENESVVIKITSVSKGEFGVEK